MKYALKLHLVCEDIAFLTTVKNKLPLITDASVESDLTFVRGGTYVDGDGNRVGVGYVVLKTLADFNILKTKFTNIVSTLDAKCLPGSFIDRVDTEHFKDGDDINSPTPCVATRIWSK